MNNFLSSSSADCPVDFIPVNEYKVRVVAFLVLITVSLFLGFSIWPLVVVLAFDFGARAFNFGHLSPLGRAAELLVKVTGLGTKLIDQAPKRFSAGIGLVFTLLILSSFFLGWSEVSFGLASVLALFCFLESVFGFCAGCQVYSLLKKIGLIG